MGGHSNTRSLQNYAFNFASEKLAFCAVICFDDAARDGMLLVPMFDIRAVLRLKGVTAYTSSLLVSTAEIFALKGGSNAAPSTLISSAVGGGE